MDADLTLSTPWETRLFWFGLFATFFGAAMFARGLTNDGDAFEALGQTLVGAALFVLGAALNGSYLFKARARQPRWKVALAAGIAAAVMVPAGLVGLWGILKGAAFLALVGLVAFALSVAGLTRVRRLWAL